MSENTPAIVISHLAYAYGRSEAVHDFSLTVPRGKCFGLFGRNGAGKTTTMKCLLNLLRPHAEQLEVLGLDPTKEEVEVKRRLAYVPDQVAFYPWMTVRKTLDYLASFRSHWNREIERSLLERFRLDPAHLTSGLSKGQRTQVALIAAICPEPELLLLDEPTSGLDPIVRREFIETVIGAYQESAPDERTILVISLFLPIWLSSDIISSSSFYSPEIRSFRYNFGEAISKLPASIKEDAIEKSKLHLSFEDAIEKSRPISFEEIDRTGMLTPETRRWLRGVSIRILNVQTVTSNSAPGRFLAWVEVTFPNGRYFYTSIWW